MRETTPGFYAYFTDDQLDRTVTHVDTLLSFQEVIGEPDAALERVYDALMTELDFRDAMQWAPRD